MESPLSLLRRGRHAFTLIELSIVLAIMGLLIGGVIAGQSMIHASELRSVGADYARYKTASFAFEEKYGHAPGDMPNATEYWGYTGGASCNNRSGTAVSSSGVCDGDGDQTIGEFPPVDYARVKEVFQFWRHLGLAGMVEGQFTGTGDPAKDAYWGSTPGLNVPKPKMTGMCWSVMHFGNYAGDGSYYAMDYGSMLYFGGAGPYTCNSPGLKPEDAWNLDTKLDDGKPAFGRVIAMYWNNACATGGASASDLINSVYNLSNKTSQCALYFTRQQ